MSKIEEMQTSIENLKKQVDETLLFADDIKKAIECNGVEVADSTPVSEYAGKIEGLFDAGKKAEHDEFWDDLQESGRRTNYVCSFGAAWTDNTFKPKYDIVPTDSYMMFRASGITDLKNLPVKLDFSKTVNAQYMFALSSVKYLGVVDLRSSAEQLSQTFAYTKQLVSIDKIILKENGTQNISTNTFMGATGLKDLTIEGCIGYSVDLHWSTLLTRDSIVSVVNALFDTASGQTLTLSIAAVNKAFETSENANDGVSSAEWLDLIATKPNWTISLTD